MQNSFTMNIKIKLQAQDYMNTFWINVTWNINKCLYIYIILPYSLKKKKCTYSKCEYDISTRNFKVCKN